jgi:hypothetical protein
LAGCIGNAALESLEPRPVLAALVYGHEVVDVGSFEHDELDRTLDAVLSPRGRTFFRTV